MEAYTTESVVSAGGVVFRLTDAGTEVVLISTGPAERWLFPKGQVEVGEEPEAAALREVREETGIVAELIEPIDTIEYWFFANRGGRRVRFHKFVHFYLMRYLSGDVKDHDHEVNEARWFAVEEAAVTLKFKNDQLLLSKAMEQIATLGA